MASPISGAIIEVVLSNTLIFSVDHHALGDNLNDDFYEANLHLNNKIKTIDLKKVAP